MEYLVVCEWQCCKLAEELKAGWQEIEIIESIDMFSCKMRIPREKESEVIAQLTNKGGYKITPVQD